MRKLREKEHFTPDGEKRRLEKKAGRKRWIKKRQQLEQIAIRNEQRPFKAKKPANQAAYKNKRIVATR